MTDDGRDVAALGCRRGPARQRVRRQPPTGRVVTLVVALLVAVATASCSTSGERADRSPASTTRRPGPPTSGPDGSSSPGTTATPGGAGPDPHPVEGPAPDPSVDDVPDEVFPGLGDPRIDVRHYDVTVDAAPGRREISGRTILTLSARTRGPLASFTLDLRGPSVSEATVDGRPATVQAAGDHEIEVRPADPLTPGRPVTVALTYAGVPDPAYFAAYEETIGWRPDGEGGWFALSEPEGTSTWTPVNDHPSDKATWRVTFVTPPDVTGVSNGRLVSSAIVDGVRRWVWEQDRPMTPYVALAAVGRYRLVERDTKVGGRPVHVTVALPTSFGTDGDRSFDRLDAILDFFAERFGPYPDDDAGAIVLPPVLDIAMETQTRPAFGSGSARDGEPFALAHELAHLWFGDDVSPARWRDLWLNEGFATYCEYLWSEHADGADVTDLVENRSNPMNGSAEAPTDVGAAAEFSPAVYGNGARALHALRRIVGDEAFFAILRRWIDEQGGGTATTDDFQALAELVSARDLSTWRQVYVDGAGRPPLPR